MIVGYIIFFFILMATIITTLHILNSKSFYNYKNTFPVLEKLKSNREIILNEIDNLDNQLWKKWPEVELYNDKINEWKVFPFYGFGIWSPNHCSKCPEITKLLKSLPGLKTALLSKLSPGTVLTPHRGWGSLSNHVLRCHYGIYVPKGNSIIVDNEERYLEENEIVVFDDSKIHYAKNNGNDDRIVLIIDMERPNWIPKGRSKVDNSAELIDFVKEFYLANN